VDASRKHAMLVESWSSIRIQQISSAFVLLRPGASSCLKLLILASFAFETGVSDWGCNDGKFKEKIVCKNFVMGMAPRILSKGQKSSKSTNEDLPRLITAKRSVTEKLKFGTKLTFSLTGWGQRMAAPYEKRCCFRRN